MVSYRKLGHTSTVFAKKQVRFLYSLTLRFVQLNIIVPKLLDRNIGCGDTIILQTNLHILTLYGAVNRNGIGPVLKTGRLCKKQACEFESHTLLH